MAANAMFGRINWIRHYLDDLADTHHIDVQDFEHVLDPIEEALKASDGRIAQLGEPRTEEERTYNESVVDEQVSLLEDLLGVAFVLCQRYITQVVSRAIWLHSYVREHKGVQLAVPSSKKDLMRHGSQTVPGTAVTKVEAMNAASDYFKHYEEWAGMDWNKPKNKAKVTIDTIKALGAESASSGNLRRIAKKLGNASFCDVVSFLRKLVSWRENVSAVYEQGLRDKGLI